MEHLQGSTSSAKGLHREFSNATDRRTERTTVTTREKIQVKTRNPVKESANAGNRGDYEKSRVKKASQAETGTPQAHKKEKEVVEGMHSTHLKSENLWS
jgi:gamma-tubulin complex component 2